MLHNVVGAGAAEPLSSPTGRGREKGQSVAGGAGRGSDSE